MSDVYGPALSGIRTYTQFNQGKLKEMDDISKQMQTLDPNSKDDAAKLNDLFLEIQQLRIAIDYANDVAGLLLKLAQLPQ